MLVFISDEFDNLIIGGDGESPGSEGKVIDALEFESENIVKAISFHLPRFNSKLNGEKILYSTIQS